MTNQILYMRGDHATGYIKCLYTPQDIGLGISLDFDGGFSEGWELTFHLLCWQIWIGA